MPRARKNAKRDIESYAHVNKARVNNLPSRAKIAPKTIRIQKRSNS